MSKKSRSNIDLQVSEGRGLLGLHSGLSPLIGVQRCELVEAAGAAAAPVPFAGPGPGPGPGSYPGLGSGLFPVGRKWLGCTGTMPSGPRGRDNGHTASLKTPENQKKKNLQL